MSGIVGGAGSKSGVIGITELENDLYCACYVEGTIAINTSDGWYLGNNSQLGVKDDPNGWWDDTERRIVPKKAGNYLCYCHGYIGNLPSGYIFATMQTFVGTDFNSNVHSMEYSSMTNDVMSHIMNVYYFDGVNDYVDQRYYTSYGSNLNVPAGKNNNVFGVIYVGDK